jgi:hypothetical protein
MNEMIIPVLRFIIFVSINDKIKKKPRIKTKIKYSLHFGAMGEGITR